MFGVALVVIVTNGFSPTVAGTLFAISYAIVVPMADAENYAVALPAADLARLAGEVVATGALVSMLGVAIFDSALKQRGSP